ncbi:hypothetical protein BGZ47_003685 [Haplosporangium gracile]|nr:hypothetical protein BGZ47_003685 [Haplosporangium gracile]
MNPETIRMIGSFIPIWTQEYIKKDNRYKDKFQPARLIVLLLVCKLWHYALIPVLWECYDYRLMAGVPMSQLKANGASQEQENVGDSQGDSSQEPGPPGTQPPIREAHDPEAIEAFTRRSSPPPRVEPVIPSSRATRRITAASGQATPGTARTAQAALPADLQGAILHAHARATAHGRADNTDLTLEVMLSVLPPMHESEFSKASSSSAPVEVTTTPVVRHRPPGTARLAGLSAHTFGCRYSSNVVIASSRPDPVPEPVPPLFHVCSNLTEF